MYFNNNQSQSNSHKNELCTVSAWLGRECYDIISRSCCDQQTKDLATQISNAVVKAFDYYTEKIVK